MIRAYAAPSMHVTGYQSIADTSHSIIILDDLTLDSGATLDLNGHALIVSSAHRAEYQAAILAGFWGLTPQGQIPAADAPRIIDSQIDPESAVMAFPVDAGYPGYLWGNTDTPDNQFLMIRCINYGDVDLQGLVNAGDINLVLGALGQNTPGLADITTSYLMGDIDFSGHVDAGDINLVLGYLNTGAPTNAGFLIGEAFGTTTGPAPSTATLTSNALHINELAVTSISAPVDAGSGHLAYTVTFNKAIGSGVDASDFLLRTTGTVTGESVLSVSPTGTSGTSYTVTVNPGTGWGTLELDVLDDDTIQDPAGHKLGGEGAYNGIAFGQEFKPSLTFSGTTAAGEGTSISLSLGTNLYTLPATSTWEVRWGDGTTDPLTGSTPMASHNYASGGGLYYPTIMATDPDSHTIEAEVGAVSISPSAPTGATVANNGDGTATITWDAPSALSTWYTLEVSIDGGVAFIYSDGIDPAAQSFDVAGITADHSYSFRLASNNTVSAAWAVLGTTVEAQQPTIALESEDISRVQDTAKFRITTQDAGISKYAVQIQERIHDANGIHFSGNWHTVYLDTVLPLDANGSYVNLPLQIDSKYKVRIVETTVDARQIASDAIEIQTTLPVSTLDAHTAVDSYGLVTVVTPGIHGDDAFSVWPYVRSTDNYYPDQWIRWFTAYEGVMADQVMVTYNGTYALLDTSGLSLPSAFQSISGSRDPATGEVTLTGWTPPGTGYQLHVFRTDANVTTSQVGAEYTSASGDTSSITFTPSPFSDMLTPNQHAGVFAMDQQQLSTIPHTPEPYGRLSNRLVLGDKPYAPTDGMAVLDAGAQVNLAWQDVNASESYYQVQRWDEVSATWQFITINGTPSDHVMDTVFVDSSELAQNPTLAYHHVPEGPNSTTLDYVWGYGLRYRVRAVRVVGANTFLSDWNGAAVADPAGAGMSLITVDIDADNNNGFNLPDRNAAERAVKDNPALPGKILRDGYHDQDGDLIPDFADGYDQDLVPLNGDDRSAGHFAQIVIEVDPSVDLAQAAIRIDYASVARPIAVNRHGLGTDENPYFYTETGIIRLWKNADANAPRNGQTIARFGNFVEPGIYQPFQLGLGANNRTITLYVEGVNPGSDRIVVQVSPTGDLTQFTAMDAARVTVVDPSPESQIDWQNALYVASGVIAAGWNPTATGYHGVTAANMDNVFKFYQNIYFFGQAAFADKFLWAGLARRTAGPLIGGLQDSLVLQAELNSWGHNIAFNLANPPMAWYARYLSAIVHTVELNYCEVLCLNPPTIRAREICAISGQLLHPAGWKPANHHGRY